MNARREEDLSFLYDENFLELRNHYKGHPIALYTGAGVSMSNEECQEEPKYGLGGWDRFMRKLLERHKGKAPQDLVAFDKKVRNLWHYKPWSIADWVCNKTGRDEFARLAKDYVQREGNFPKRRKESSLRKKSAKKPRKTPKKEYKQLSGNFLNQAPTLNAVCAFCASFDAIVTGTKNKTYQVGLNPRVRAVVTTNYDPFLEAASSNLYIRNRLRPVGRVSSSVGKPHQIPVFHIHGYVPYPKKGKTEQRPGTSTMVDPVLTTEDYHKARPRKADPYCFTMGTEIHLLRHYRVLFIGFSFRDEWVNDVLRKLNKERVKKLREQKLNREQKINKERKKLKQKDISRPYHYALMKKTEVNEMKTAKGKNFFDRLGVKIIGLDDFYQIPLVLKQLYIHGLCHDNRGQYIPLPMVPRTRRKKSSAGARKKRTKQQRPKDRKQQITFIKPDQYWDHLCRCRNCSVKSRPGRSK